MISNPFDQIINKNIEIPDIKFITVESYTYNVKGEDLICALIIESLENKRFNLNIDAKDVVIIILNKVEDLILNINGLCNFIDIYLVKEQEINDEKYSGGTLTYNTINFNIDIITPNNDHYINCYTPEKLIITEDIGIFTNSKVDFNTYNDAGFEIQQITMNDDYDVDDITFFNYNTGASNGVDIQIENLGIAITKQEGVEDLNENEEGIEELEKLKKKYQTIYLYSTNKEYKKLIMLKIIDINKQIKALKND